MLLVGAFGSNPEAVGKVLKESGIEYVSVGMNEMTNPGTYIISYWNSNKPWNVHTVAVSYNGNVYISDQFHCRYWLDISFYM